MTSRGVSVGSCTPHNQDARTPEEWARWVFDTCLMFGCAAETATAVAGHFAAGVRKLQQSSVPGSSQ